MGIEIERKFLVRSNAWRSAIESSMPCKQGYVRIQGEGSVRVRILGDKGFLTLKGPRKGLTRAEFEYEIPVNEANALLDQMADVGPLTKTRHIVIHEDKRWEVDEFSGENTGLVLAEIELEHDQQAITIPDWVGKEVSDDERFFNARLAKHPLNTWTRAQKSGSA